MGSNHFKAGWAQRVITPPLGLLMGGRGLRKDPGMSVLDNLFAQAAVLRDAAGNTLVLVSLDLVGLSSGRGLSLRKTIAQKAGIGIEWVILNFAHIHSGPMATADIYSVPMPQSQDLKKYERERDRKIVSCAMQALQSTADVTGSIHTGETDIGINRRKRDEQGNMMMRPNPDGPYNRDLWVLDLKKTGSDDRCILFSCACHPVMVYGFAWNSISADYPGNCRKRISQEASGNVQAQFLQSTAGNIRPRILADPKTGKFRKAGPEDVENTGKELASDVFSALSQEGEELRLGMKAAQRTIPAPKDMNTVPDEKFWEDRLNDPYEPNRISAAEWHDKIKAGETLNKAVPWLIGLIKLDDANYLACIAGEAVAEWTNNIRRGLDLKGVHVLGYCQETEGYLPVEEILDEGGYEEYRSVFWHRHGPARFAAGLNDTMRRGFSFLKNEIDLEVD